jgi:short-subunit dehydrogenase
LTQPRSAGAFAGQVVVVTGASSGVGAALARAFAEAGADVALFARSETDLERVADACRQAGREALVVPGDVTQPRGLRRGDRADDRALRPHRHGRGERRPRHVGALRRARRHRRAARLLDVNVLGVANVFLSALPHVRASRGMLVAISSVQGVVGVPGRSGYAASKHALQGLCDSLRSELRGTGVGVSTVMAHWVRGTNLRARALGPDGAPRGTAAPHRSRSAIDVDVLTRAVLAAVRGRKRRVFVPGYLRLLSPLLAEVAPGLAERVLHRRVGGWRARGTRPDPTWRTVVDVGHAFALRLPTGHVLSRVGDATWYVHGFLDGDPLVPDVAISFLTGITIDALAERDFPAGATLQRIRLGPATSGARVDATYATPACSVHAVDLVE